MRSNYDTDIFGPLLAAVHDLVGGCGILMSLEFWNPSWKSQREQNAGICWSWTMPKKMSLEKQVFVKLELLICIILHAWSTAWQVNLYEGRVGADDVGMRDTAYRFSAAWRAWHLLGFAEGWVSLNQLVTPLCSKSTRNMSTWFGPSQAKPEELPCAVGLHLVASVFLKQETHMGV